MSSGVDVFVSYTAADQPWAEWIAWELEAAGFATRLQAWDFTAGHDWVHEMDRATSAARRTVAVVSASYLASRHGAAEWRVGARAGVAAGLRAGGPRSADLRRPRQRWAAVRRAAGRS